MDPAIAQRRRRRRIAEHRRRAAIRRRRALLGAAAAAFVFGGVVGAASGGKDQEAPPSGTAALLDQGTDLASAPQVSDFHGPVPILMYHAIEPAPVGAAMPSLFVPESEFEDEVRWLAAEGYHAVTLDQVFAAWNEGDPIAAKPVVLSFDDGLESQYAGARPVLQQLGWPGDLNLAVSHLESGDITVAQVKELIADGWEVDSHTFSHVDVTTLDPDQLAREIGASRGYLQRTFDVPVDFFCYPAGRYDDEAIEAVKDAGYLGATTTEEGLATPDEDPDLLSRIRVEAGDGADGLAAKLDAAGAS